MTLAKIGSSRGDRRPIRGTARLLSSAKVVDGLAT